METREGEIIRLIGTLNEKIAGRDKKQYYADNLETLKEKHNEYRIKNSKKIREQRHKFTIKNRENKKEYDKEYREKNKEKIKERKAIKIVCECGCEITKEHKSKHLKTKKHEELLFKNSHEK